MTAARQRPEIRLVEWIDSSCQSGWHPIEVALDGHGVGGCRSVGFVITENDTEVFLAQSEDYRHGNLAEVLAIPVVAITKQTTLRKEQSA